MTGATVHASVPGKLILMGEHAAVYGRPAIVATIGMRMRAVAQASSITGVQLDLPDVGVRRIESWDEVEHAASSARERWTRDPHDTAHGDDDPARLVRIALGESLARRGAERPHGVRLSLVSEIPLGAGFGSSAATAVVTAGALLPLLGVDPGAQHLCEVAMEVERRQHGRPSGVDHHAVVCGGVSRIERRSDGEVSMEQVATSPCVLRGLQVFHTGRAAQATGAVVAAVRERLAVMPHREHVLDRMGQCTEQMEWALSDLFDDHSAVLLESIREYQRLLDRLGVVPARVQEAVRAVEAAGGAAKISGAGALDGTGAGALIVYWPDEQRPVPELASFSRIRAPLGVDGIRIQSEVC